MYVGRTEATLRNAGNRAFCNLFESSHEFRRLTPLRSGIPFDLDTEAARRSQGFFFMTPLQPQPPPTLSAGAAFASTMAFAQQEQFDDDDDKSKVSRWQIGSSSLTVLEQVYAMEPFPGKSARARPDLLLRGGA
jgi:hypothetical protein